ncbi:MAG TPA: CotH kinase family protein [Polyangiales bacterium]|nr:CotH kinase family protein [Polyangiales bacterium]
MDAGTDEVAAAGSIATARAPEPGGNAGAIVAEPEDDASQAIFGGDRVKTYEISVAPEDLATIDARPSAETYVPAQVAIDGERVEKVGLRYKGSAGAFIAPCTAATMPGPSNRPKVGKCSMKLAFDYIDDDARFKGLKKLNLHSMGRDRTYMREQLGYALFREMGVASPRTAYVKVVINGKLEGLFLAVEQIDGRFTRSRFSEGGEGNLYKEVWPLYDDPKVYRAALESNKGDATNVDKMLAFAQRVRFAPDTATEWIDRDYTLRYIAVDRVLLNDDGVFHFYCSRSGNNPGPFANHNYYWYEAERAGRLWLVPWDLDTSLGGEIRPFIDVEWSEPASCNCHVYVGYPQRAPSCDPLIAQFAKWKKEYAAVMDEFLAGPFAQQAVDAKLDAWSKQIAPYVEETAGLGGAPDREVWEDELLHLRYVLDVVREYRGYPYGAE